MPLLYILIGGIFGTLVVGGGAYFYGWHQNAVLGTHYDLNSLVDFIKWVEGILVAQFSAHSTLNIPIPFIDQWKNKGGNQQ